MAEQKSEKKSEKKKAKTTKVYSYYTASGSSLERKKRTCPKCGDGFFMSEHKDRFSCGKCGYTEFKKQ
ncbi:MAG: 30S ribosomal protein S27ae [Candidatus Woesearchaeota archaeon]|nr:30S ribosomal protein S27ae [Candidatus Woesearchaeota archaeon]